MSGLNKYQQYIIEEAFKNSVKNKPNTSSLLAWYEEEGDLKKRVDVSSIWVDADYIPNQAPDLQDGQTYFAKINNLQIGILKYFKKSPVSKIKGTNNSFQNENLKDSIESSYGIGYAVKLSDTNGDVIPFGLNKWVIDAGAGTLTFIDGIPSGYAQPFYVSFYKYIGRKGNDTILLSDGQTKMLPGYKPTEDKSLVTKDYVDKNITDVSKIVEKLIPNTPSNFAGKDLVLLNKHRSGTLLTSTSPTVDVVYTDDKVLKFRVPDFWDEKKKGKFVVFVNNNIVHSIPINELRKGYDDGIIKVEEILESYPDNLVADDFYKSIRLTVSLNYINTIYPKLSGCISSIRVEWQSLDELEKHISNSMIIGWEDYSGKGVIDNVQINPYGISQKYISGVPALVKDDNFKMSCRILTLKNFKKQYHGHIKIDGIVDKDIPTELTYAGSNAAINYSNVLTVPTDVYSETMLVKIDSWNLDSEINGSLEITYNIRTDSVSDESNRVTSSSSIDNLGKPWDPKQSLKNNNELQMLDGLYQWPRGDYTKNGIIDPNIEPFCQPGPDYSNITDGTRYVTFKYNLENASGFYFTIENAQGFECSPQTFAFSNVSSLKCFIDSKNTWLNMNLPYDGVLSPFDCRDNGCLVVNRSNTSKRYCTFGTEVVSGTMYITLGISYNLDIKLSGISVSVDK